MGRRTPAVRQPPARGSRGLPRTFSLGQPPLHTHLDQDPTGCLLSHSPLRTIPRAAVIPQKVMSLSAQPPGNHVRAARWTGQCVPTPPRVSEAAQGAGALNPPDRGSQGPPKPPAPTTRQDRQQEHWDWNSVGLAPRVLHHWVPHGSRTCRADKCQLSKPNSQPPALPRLFGDALHSPPNTHSTPGSRHQQGEPPT